MGLLRKWRHLLESSNVQPGANVPPDQQQQTDADTPNAPEPAPGQPAEPTNAPDPTAPGQPTEQVGTNADPSTPGQPTEQVGQFPEDQSLAQPTGNPVDNPQTTTTPDAEPEQEESYLSRLQDATANLTASEVPSPGDVPALLGVLLYEHDNGEFPPPLHERFPDQFPNPDDQ